MLIPRIEISVKQNSKTSTTNKLITLPPRDKVIRVNYCHEFEFEEDMSKFICSGTIRLPKTRLWVNLSNNPTLHNTNIEELETLVLRDIAGRDEEDNLIYNLIADYDPNSGFSSILSKVANRKFNRNKQPMFKIGDIVNVRCTYINPSDNKLVPNKDIYFQDFVITKLALNDTLEIGISSLTWFFKEIPFEEKVIKGNVDFNNIIKKYVNILNEKLPDGFSMNYFLSESLSFNSQMLINGNMSFAQFLDKLRTDYGIQTYMAYGVLVFGRLSPSISELPIDKNFDDRKFTLQTNVIDDSSLEFKNKDGLKLSAVVSNTFVAKTGKTTKDGHEKTKKTKISVYIEYNKKNNEILNEVNSQSNTFNTKDLSKLLEGVIILYDNNGNKVGSVPSLNDEKGDGERRTFVDPSAKNTNDLILYGLNQLQKYYYDGMTGSFETFGQPTTFVTDSILFEDLNHPEKNGKYRVKGVKTSFGMGGYRQNVTLDIKIPQSTTPTGGIGPAPQSF